MWTWFRIGNEDESQVAMQSEGAIPEVQCSTIGAWAMLLTGLVLLALGGKATEIGAVTGALSLGMSEIVVGGTVVAIATSLPEVVTTIIAAKKIKSFSFRFSDLKKQLLNLNLEQNIENVDHSIQLENEREEIKNDLEDLGMTR